MLNKKTVDDLKELKGRKVLVRCDFNVPIQDGVIQSYNRIDGALPTIKKLMEQGKIEKEMRIYEFLATCDSDDLHIV